MFLLHVVLHTGNYVQRQVERWSRQYRASVTHPIPSMDQLMEWLPQQSPSSEKTTLVHGDFRSALAGIPNFMLRTHGRLWMSVGVCFSLCVEREPVPQLGCVYISMFIVV